MHHISLCAVARLLPSVVDFALTLLVLSWNTDLRDFSLALSLSSIDICKESSNFLAELGRFGHVLVYNMPYTDLTG